MVQAHLKARETHDGPPARYQAKLHLIKSLYQRGWQRQDVLELFRFIDWVLELPGELEKRLWKEVQSSEEGQKMRYCPLSKGWPSTEDFKGAATKARPKARPNGRPNYWRGYRGGVLVGCLSGSRPGCVGDGRNWKAGPTGCWARRP